MTTDGLAQRVTENVAMGALVVATRTTLARRLIRDVVLDANRIATTLCWASPLAPNDDTVERARALAYRWSDLVPGASCLHRAIATQVWLAAYRIETRVVLGIRKRDELEGHAWLEVQHPNGVLFVDDDDGYPVELPYL